MRNLDNLLKWVTSSSVRVQIFELCLALVLSALICSLEVLEIVPLFVVA